MPMRITQVVGARPNFMKIAPVMQAISRRGFAEQKLVHTGQHYDAGMSDVFFKELDLPNPDVFLGVGSGSHAEQTAAVMVAFDRILAAEPPDLVVVAGDVNSTLACALTAAKRGVPVAHVEAGLRANDWTMPEEINRVLTDRLSDLLLTPSSDADENLRREGIPADRIHRVGNAMIDSLLQHLPLARQSGVHGRLGVKPRGYVLVTLHRPSNVDEPQALGRHLAALGRIATLRPVVFPIHPRTRKRLAEFGLRAPDGVQLIDPAGYLDFLCLTAGAALVLTDSGGLQEETTALGVPCLTLRLNTERPITLEQGTNLLVGVEPDDIVAAAERALGGQSRRGGVPELLGRTDRRANRRAVRDLVR